MKMILLAVVLFGTDVTMVRMETMAECLAAARRVAPTADQGNTAKRPRWRSKRLESG